MIGMPSAPTTSARWCAAGPSTFPRRRTAYVLEPAVVEWDLRTRLDAAARVQVLRAAVEAAEPEAALVAEPMSMRRTASPAGSRLRDSPRNGEAARRVR
jgi:hypothetical protein